MASHCWMVRETRTRLHALFQTCPPRCMRWPSGSLAWSIWKPVESISPRPAKSSLVGLTASLRASARTSQSQARKRGVARGRGHCDAHLCESGVPATLGYGVVPHNPLSGGPTSHPAGRAGKTARSQAEPGNEETRKAEPGNEESRIPHLASRISHLASRNSTHSSRLPPNRPARHR